MFGGHNDTDELPSCGHIVLLMKDDLSFALAIGRRRRIWGRATATELSDPVDVRDRYFLGSNLSLIARCDASSRLWIYFSLQRTVERRVRLRGVELLGLDVSTGTGARRRKQLPALDWY